MFSLLLTPNFLSVRAVLDIQMAPRAVLGCQVSSWDEPIPQHDIALDFGDGCIQGDNGVTRSLREPFRATAISSTDSPEKTETTQFAGRRDLDVAAPHCRCHTPWWPAEGGDLPDGSLARSSRRRVVDQCARIRGPSGVLVIAVVHASLAAARHRRAGGSESGAARRRRPRRRRSSRLATRQEPPSCPRSR